MLGMVHIKDSKWTCDDTPTPPHHRAQNLPNALASAWFFVTRRTLNLTVFDSGRHWPVQSVSHIGLFQQQHSHAPTVTVSPTAIRNAGETCAERFL
jgi:hypothetical protein